MHMYLQHEWKFDRLDSIVGKEQDSGERHFLYLLCFLTLHVQFLNPLPHNAAF